jgi:hypothetical protein
MIMPAPAGRFRCRDHPSCEVTWRGTGCPICVRRTRRKRAARNKRPIEHVLLPNDFLPAESLWNEGEDAHQNSGRFG